MKSKITQGQVSQVGQTGYVHWTATFTTFLAVLFLCFALGWIITNSFLRFVSLTFDIQSGFFSDILPLWMMGCTLFFALIFPPFMFIMSIIASRIADRPAWRAGKLQSLANMRAGIALMLLWCFALMIFLLANGSF